MNPQLDIFSTPVHYSVRRNANGGQNNLDAERPHFEGQAKWVLDQLLLGRRINGRIAREEREIFDLRARVYTLRKSHIDVRSEAIPGAKGMKDFYLEPQEIERVKNLK